MITNVYNIRDELTNEIVGYKMVLKDGKEYGVPLQEANRHYQEIQEWAAIEGNNITDPGA